MDNKFLDELSVEELERISRGACELQEVFNQHFDFDTIMRDKILSQMYIYNITITNVCWAQLKKIFKNNPDSIYSKI